MEARGVVGYAQHVGCPVGRDLDVCSHAGQEFAVRVPRRDDDRVGDNVCGLGAKLANLLHLALEALAGEGVDSEGDLIALVDTANVGFNDSRLDLDLG